MSFHTILLGLVMLGMGQTAFATNLSVPVLKGSDYELGKNQFQATVEEQPGCLDVFNQGLQSYLSSFNVENLAIGGTQVEINSFQVVELQDQDPGSFDLNRLVKFQGQTSAGETAYLILKTQGDLFCDYEKVRTILGGYIQ